MVSLTTDFFILCPNMTNFYILEILCEAVWLSVDPYMRWILVVIFTYCIFMLVMQSAYDTLCERDFTLQDPSGRWHYVVLGCTSVDCSYTYISSKSLPHHIFARCYPVFPLMCNILLFPRCCHCSAVCTEQWKYIILHMLKIVCLLVNMNCVEGT